MPKRPKRLYPLVYARVKEFGELSKLIDDQVSQETGRQGRQYRNIKTF
jgi:hypothetical protein